VIIAITPTPELEHLLTIYEEWLRVMGYGRQRKEVELKVGAIRQTLAAREKGEPWAQPEEQT
jgi:hypothetical protein